VSPYSTGAIKRNSTIALFTARAFLPGLFERKAFLIVGFFLPLLDFATDCVNAGTVLRVICLLDSIHYNTVYFFSEEKFHVENDVLILHTFLHKKVILQVAISLYYRSDNGKPPKYQIF